MTTVAHVGRLLRINPGLVARAGAANVVVTGSGPSFDLVVNGERGRFLTQWDSLGENYRVALERGIEGYLETGA